MEGGDDCGAESAARFAKPRGKFISYSKYNASYFFRHSKQETTWCGVCLLPKKLTLLHHFLLDVLSEEMLLPCLDSGAPCFFGMIYHSCLGIFLFLFFFFVCLFYVLIFHSQKGKSLYTLMRKEMVSNYTPFLSPDAWTAFG